MLVVLDAPVETFGRSYAAGTRFEATGWIETDHGEFCELFDSRGIHRVSHCPADRVRVVFAATHPPLAWSDSKSHPTVVDLDRGEFWSSTVLGWQVYESQATSHQVARQQGSDLAVPSRIQNLHCETGNKADAGTPDQDQSDTRGLVHSGITRESVRDPDRSQPSDDAQHPRADSVLGSETDTERNRVCGPCEYPAPALGMTADQLRGHRRVKGSDGHIVSRFGPDHPDDRQWFRDWCRELREFCERMDGVR